MTDEPPSIEMLASILDQVDLSFLKKRGLCDNCLGRIFAKVGRGIPNSARGEMVRAHLGIDAVLNDKCWECSGLSAEFQTLADVVVRGLSDWEMNTFLIGSKIDPEIIEKEETLWSETIGQYSEPIKAEVNREVGKLVYSMTGKDVSFDRPDIVCVVDTRYDSVELQISPLFIYGRYRKLVRGIPQTRWPCIKCQGKGCERCGGTGKMYQTSVEEAIGTVVIKHSGGTDHKFHGMGREDIDALMLGKGRPFVLEIKEPKIRHVSLDKIALEINGLDNGIEVSGLRSSKNEEVIAVKSARPDKRYWVSVSLDSEVKEEKLKEVVLSLGGKTIAQRTPQRVAHRRADKARSRMIKTLEASEFAGNRVVLELTTEAGTYVKEFVNGDGGRTIPSLAGELGVGCTVEELNVLEILDEGQMTARD